MSTEAIVELLRAVDAIPMLTDEESDMEHELVMELDRRGVRLFR